jgi:transcriptional regulator with XRE-family HTH domain
MFPVIASEMKKRGETQQDLARLLQLDVSQISRKLRGEIDWSIGDAEVMCLHYSNREFLELFRKEVNENETMEN